MATDYNIVMQHYNGSDYDNVYPQPSEHAASHATDGNDPIAPSDIGAATAAQGVKADAAMPKTGGNFTGIVKMDGINLTYGVDYGTSYPANPVAGRLFFKKL